MTARGWKHHAWRLAVLLAALLLVGALTGRIWAVLFVALVLFAVWEIVHLVRLQAWLAKPQSELPPGRGIWSDIYNGIQDLNDKHRHQTDRYEARLSEFQDLTNSVPDATLVVDPDGEITWCNQSAEPPLGLRLPADLGQAITNLVRVPGFAD